jgi:DNA invertase Pin-like site-specific DNA recombinase
MPKTLVYTNTQPIVLPKWENGALTAPPKPKERLKTIRYCLYARKSTEDDERQALSIDSQIKEMQEQAKEEKLKVTEVRRESFSAKQSGRREVFNQLLADVAQDKFQGILTWAPDRLSRNAGDLGSIVDLMDQGLLTQIRTHGQTFTGNPNDKFLLMILCSQAKLENDNKGVNVKRGLRAKCEMGYRPGVSPLGYLNDYTGNKGEKKVQLDPERAPVVKEMFEKVAYQGCSGREIFKWLWEEKNFRTRAERRVTLSMIYEMLNNTYYCGVFEYPSGGGNWYKVNHESIITKELFDEVQARISVTPKTRPGTKEFDFTKLLKCGSCGGGVTAEEKFKRFKNGTIRRYVYYHCTRSRDMHCPEKYIREEMLIEELFKVIDKLPLDRIATQEKLKVELEKYNRFNQNVLGKTAENQVKIPRVNARNFAKYILLDGSREEKREFLSCLKTNLYLKDRKILTEVPGTLTESEK